MNNTTLQEFKNLARQGQALSDGQPQRTVARIAPPLLRGSVNDLARECAALATEHYTVAASGYSVNENRERKPKLALSTLEVATVE